LGCLDGEQLRPRQNPLKVRYRTEPAAALATRHAEDGPGSEVSCSVQTSQTVTPDRPAHRQRRRCRPRPRRRAVSAADGVGGDAPISRNEIRMTGKVHAQADPGFRGIIGVGSAAPAGYSGFASTAGVKPRPKTSMPSWSQPSPTAPYQDNEPSCWPLVRSLRGRCAETEPR